VLAEALERITLDDFQQNQEILACLDRNVLKEGQDDTYYKLGD
jgi:hypothetical protein